MSKDKGGRPPKLTPEQAHYLRLARSCGTSYATLAAFWGLSSSTVRRYCADECRAHKREVA